MEVIRLVGDADAGEAEVRFAATDPVFAGHFPDDPVLPGVVLIDSAVEIVARATRRAWRLERVASIKFSNVVRPGQIVGFAFQVAPAGEGTANIRVSGRWFHDTTKVAELVFTAAAHESAGDPV